MACCSCGAIEGQFGDARAQADLARYRRDGPDQTTRLLIDVVKHWAPPAGTLLDVGAGIGVIHHELVDDVVTEATHVEVSKDYIRHARQEADRRGHAAAVRFMHGDLVAIAHDVPAADTVTLDRVVCCYADFRSLLLTSAGKSRRVLALSYPKDRWFVRLAFWLQNRARGLRGNAFRTYVHSEGAMMGILQDAGFERCFDGGTFAWRVDVYSRSDPAG